MVAEEGEADALTARGRRGAILAALSKQSRKRCVYAASLLLVLLLVFALVIFTRQKQSDTVFDDGDRKEIPSALHLDETDNAASSSSLFFDDIFSNKSLSRLDLCARHSDNLVFRAVCGSDYQLPRPSTGNWTREWKIAFYGRQFQIPRIVTLLGCPPGPGQCPFSPNCRIKYTTSLGMALASNVIIVFQEEYSLIPRVRAKLPPNSATKLGLYWREAHRTFVPLDVQRLVDFEMGVHLHSHILNPVFILPPTILLRRKHDAVTPRPKLAIFVASDCKTLSHREEYLDALVAALGEDRVSRYGECFSTRLPGFSIESFEGLVLRHKFYFAFENTIQTGYTTEKLFDTLALDILPVYFGALDAPNITKRASYIRASDFPTPEALAKHLLYLDANEAEYQRYFEWKRGGGGEDVFDPSYLALVARQWMGPAEMHPTAKFHNARRAGACCRLCNEEFMSRTFTGGATPIQAPLDWPEIQRKFFAK